MLNNKGPEAVGKRKGKGTLNTTSFSVSDCDHQSE